MMGRLCDTCCKPASWVIYEENPSRPKEYGDACDAHLGEVAGNLHIDGALQIIPYLFPVAGRES